MYNRALRWTLIRHRSLGILQPRTPPAPVEPWRDLPKVLELAERRNAVSKVSGACASTYGWQPRAG